MFTTNQQGKKLIQAITQSSHQVILAKMSPTHWGFLVDGHAFKDIAIRTLIRTVYTTIPLWIMLSIGFFATLIRNRIVYNEWQVRQTIEYILFEPITAAPKLDKITFPSKLLTENDIQNDKTWKEGGVGISQGCAICLEEFSVGHETRELPCRHTFHATW